MGVEQTDPRLTAQEQREQYEAQVARELQEGIAYHDSLKEEFKDADPDDVELAKKAAKRVIELVPDAGLQIKHLINHAESEAIRKDLSKWVFGVAMKAAEATGEIEDWQKLLSGLGLKKNTEIRDDT